MQKLTLKEKLGYGSGSIGDAASYSFIGTFLMFFLTTVAGIAPATAGLITAVGAVWNALFNPLIGYCSDIVRTRYGKRRPVILAFAIPLALTIFLLYTNLPLSENFKAVYYGIMLVLFWTCYTGFFVPYLALGVQYTSDYDDRTVLRLYASVFNMFGTILAMVMPTLLVKWLILNGHSTSQSWSITGAIIGVVSAISIIVTVLVSKKFDPPCIKEEITTAQKFDLLAIFKEYISIARLKPVKHLVFASILSLICYEMLLADMVYFFTYNLGFSATKISFYLFVRTIIGLILVPLVGKAALTFDKRETLIGFFLLGAAGMVLMKFTGIENVVEIFAYIFFLSICTCVYWDLMPSIYYDICDYDRLETGHNRQGTIVSFQGLVESIALGLGGLILGLILQVAGFDGALPVQTSQALLWIENSATWIPILFLLMACIAIYKYPITKKVHGEIMDQLNK
jgi:Na+/melibiose symporter and related transporters